MEFSVKAVRRMRFFSRPNSSSLSAANIALPFAVQCNGKDTPNGGHGAKAVCPRDLIHKNRFISIQYCEVDGFSVFSESSRRQGRTVSAIGKRMEWAILTNPGPSRRRFSGKAETTKFSNQEQR